VSFRRVKKTRAKPGATPADESRVCERGLNGLLGGRESAQRGSSLSFGALKRRKMMMMGRTLYESINLENGDFLVGVKKPFSKTLKM
jgi:hypothetical protein